MSHRKVYVALQQFCQQSNQPRRVLLEAGFDVKENPLGRRLLRDELPQLLEGAEAVLAGVEPYDAAVLAALPHLRCISRCGTGVDSIDLAAAQQRQIAVLTTPDEAVEPVAQMTVAMILSLARNFPVHCADARSGVWRKQTGYLLSEWTIGLIGFGRIGQAVERYLRMFQPRVLVADPKVRIETLPPSVRVCELPTLLAEADVVSLHASMRPDKDPIVGRRELAAMKRGSRLVNTSRGYLVDEQALYEALISEKLSSAALDVFAAEPYSGSLAQLPQVLCTPHVSTLTAASRMAMELKCANNIVEYLSQSTGGVTQLGVVSHG